jgi:hypothetical protein
VLHAAMLMSFFCCNRRSLDTEDLRLDDIIIVLVSRRCPRGVQGVQVVIFRVYMGMREKT